MQRGRPPGGGTATSLAPSSGTPLQPSRRAARAGYSAVRSGEDVKIALSTWLGRKPFASWRARSSSTVASRMASLVLAVAVVAPRSPRRILDAMSLAEQLRLMVLTDAALLKGRDVVDVCCRAVAGGATALQLRHKGAMPRELAALARVLVAALPVPVLVNDRVDVALAAGAAGAHLGQEDPPLTALRPQVPAGFVLGLSVGSRAEAGRGRDWPADYWSAGPGYATANKAQAGPHPRAPCFAAFARAPPARRPVIAPGGITAATAGALAKVGAAGVAGVWAVAGGGEPGSAPRAPP